MTYMFNIVSNNIKLLKNKSEYNTNLYNNFISKKHSFVFKDFSLYDKKQSIIKEITTNYAILNRLNRAISS